MGRAWVGGFETGGGPWWVASSWVYCSAEQGSEGLWVLIGGLNLSLFALSAMDVLNDDWMLSASVIIQELDLGQENPGLYYPLNFAY